MVVGCFKDTETDVLQDRTSKKIIELAEEGPKDNKILVLNTMPCPVFKNMSRIRFIVDEIRKRNRSAMVHDINSSDVSGDDMIEGMAVDEGIALAISEFDEKGVPDAVMAFNLAKISDEERSRVFCRRFGYCNPLLLKKMSEDKNFGDLPKLVEVNEDNAIMDAAKWKKKPHHRNDPDISMGRPPWFRVYVDGTGGGNSMGCESYEGAIGSYLFVCSSTG